MASKNIQVGSKLLKIPRELRSKIYLLLFAGSILALLPACVKYDRQQSSKGHSNGFASSSPLSVLLTCRQVYGEARSILYAMTRFTIGGASPSAIKDLPDFTKAHILHLERLCFHFSTNRIPCFEEVKPFHEKLDIVANELPKLKVCVLTTARTLLALHFSPESHPDDEYLLSQALQRPDTRAMMVAVAQFKLDSPERSMHFIQAFEFCCPQGSEKPSPEYRDGYVKVCLAVLAAIDLVVFGIFADSARLHLL